MLNTESLWSVKEHTLQKLLRWYMIALSLDELKKVWKKDKQLTNELVKVSGDTRGGTDEIKEIKFKEEEQQVINHMDLGKRSQTETNGENILEETRDGHESSASTEEMLEHSSKDYTFKQELKSYF